MLQSRYECIQASSGPFSSNRNLQAGSASRASSALAPRNLFCKFRNRDNSSSSERQRSRASLPSLRPQANLRASACNRRSVSRPAHDRNSRAQPSAQHDDRVARSAFLRPRLRVAFEPDRTAQTHRQLSALDHSAERSVLHPAIARRSARAL